MFPSRLYSVDVFMTAIRPNVMGGTNVVVYRNGATYHVASYSSRQAARRAVETGAALRRALRTEGYRA